MFIHILRRWINREIMAAVTPNVLIHVLSGGFKPGRGYKNDAALDLPIRAIVGTEFADEPCPRRRFTVWGFDDHKPFDDGGGVMDPSRSYFDGEIIRKFAYRLMPGETIPVGLGVAVEIPPGYAGFVAPRGSTIRALSLKSRLEIANSNVPIDSDFLSEIWAEIVNHGPKPVSIFKGLRLCQLIVHPVAMNFVIALRHHKGVLPENGNNRRAAAAHGSTGF